MKKRIEAIQARLADEGLDGWLIYDFRELNPVAQEFAPYSGIATRRWFLYIPSKGRPVALVHKIEEGGYHADYAEKRTYSGWKAMEEELGRMLGGQGRIAMEYSPRNAVPYVSFVDAGTLEMVRGFGPEVVSSANLVQHFQARWTPEGLASHHAAANLLVNLQREMFEMVAKELSAGRSITEYDVQSEIVSRMERGGMKREHDPIVGAGPNSALPHYEPSKELFRGIFEGDILLLDIFCAQQGEGTVHADITWTAYMGSGPVPQKMQEVFNVVTGGRDAGVELINKRFEAGDPVSGWEVDDAVRGVIMKAGYGDYFTHRTGHSLGLQIHYNGVNIDNFETKDTRMLEPGLGFTIEPGVYLEGEFGIRSEIDCYIGENGLEITTLPLQTELPAML